MTGKSFLVSMGLAVVAALAQLLSHQGSERFRGHFIYSWEGGGFFIPCGASPGGRDEDLDTAVPGVG